MISECPICHGSGKITRIARFKDEENDIDLSMQGRVTCPNCGGAGALLRDKITTEYGDVIIEGLLDHRDRMQMPPLAKYREIPIIQIA